MISRALEAEILRLHHTEHWPVGTIAVQLRVHHSTVRRVLAQAGVPAAGRTARPSIVEPYLAFIAETLTVQRQLFLPVASTIFATLCSVSFRALAAILNHRCSLCFVRPLRLDSSSRRSLDPSSLSRLLSTKLRVGMFLPRILSP